jgi:hypothetical protein
MKAISKTAALLGVSTALTLSWSHVFAKTVGGSGQVHVAGTSAVPSGTGGSQSKWHPDSHPTPRGGVPPGPPNRHAMDHTGVRTASWFSVTDRERKEEIIMTAISKVVSLLAISAALTLSGSCVFAKSGGGPSQVHTSGTSAAPSSSSAGADQSKRRPGSCGHHCMTPPGPGATQPTCHGPHRGPNGVMIQCD